MFIGEVAVIERASEQFINCVSITISAGKFKGVGSILRWVASGQILAGPVNIPDGAYFRLEGSM